MPTPPRPTPRELLIPSVCLVLGLFVLYAVPAAGLGFWEPWETSIASLGWLLNQDDHAGSLFLPMRDGELLARPWLSSTLAWLGYRLGGGGEFGFRLPLIAMNLAAVLGAYLVLARWFGRWRALLAAVLFGVSPAVVLSSASLAGEAHYVAPLTLALLLAGYVASEQGRAHPSWIVVVGILLGGCAWGLGLPGLMAPLAILAMFALGTRDPDRQHTPGTWIGAWAVIGALVLYPVARSYFDGGTVLATEGRLDATLVETLAAGWPFWKDVAGALVGLGVPCVLFGVALPVSKARALWHPVATPIAVALMTLMVALPALQMSQQIAALDNPELGGPLRYMLFQSVLTERVLPQHITFDIFIRFVGFSAYPTVLLAPLGLGYLARTQQGRGIASDDTELGQRLFKMLLVVWVAVALGVFGVAATMSRTYIFTMVLPIAAGAALALTDRGFVQDLLRNRTSFFLIGFASAMLLLVLSKDIRGTQNLEMGRPGPQVIFEFLLTDGKIDFPADYAFTGSSLWLLAWLAALFLTFARPLDNVARFGTLLQTFQGRTRRVGTRIFEIATFWSGRLRRLRFGVPSTTAGITLFAVLVSAWSAQLAFRDAGRLTDHFSQKGLLDTWERLRGDSDETPLYVVGVRQSDNTFYLRDGAAVQRERISDLRELFCTSEGRVFAVIPTDSLAEAYNTIRLAGTSEDGCPVEDLYVVDGRSNRYQLLSNQLHQDRGEAQQSFLAQNLFTDDTLPEDLQRPTEPVVVDGRLDLVGWTVSPTQLRSGDVEIAAFWRVRETPRGSYKAFIHIDYGGNRINGDHDLVGGRFPMNLWVAGDIVRDAYTVRVSRADRAGTYRIFYGFFRGDDRLTVVPASRDNRVDLGTLEVR